MYEQPREIVFNTMRYRSSENKNKDQDIFRANSVSYVKVQKMFK